MAGRVVRSVPFEKRPLPLRQRLGMIGLLMHRRRVTVAVDADRPAHRRPVVAGCFEELAAQDGVFAGLARAQFVTGAESVRRNAGQVLRE